MFSLRVQPNLRIALLSLSLAACQIAPTSANVAVALPTSQPSTSNQSIQPLAEESTPASSPVKLASPTPESYHPTAALPPSAVITPFPKTTAFPVETAACELGYFSPTGFLPDNHRLVARVDKGISILDLDTGLEELFLQPGKNVVSAALSPDGSYLVLGLEDFSIQFYQMAGKQLLYTFTGSTGLIASLKFSARGDRLVAASDDSWVRIWDLSGAQVFSFQPPLWDGAPSSQVAAAISPDGKRLATKATEDSLKFWDLQSKARLLEIKTIYGAFNGADIAFSPDGQLIAWSLGGGPVSLNRLSDGLQVWSGGTYSFAFSPDGRLLAYSDQDDAGNQRVALRSVTENKTVRVLGPIPAMTYRLIFSPNGRFLASVTDQGTTIWDSDSGKTILTRSSICAVQ
jgi:WD40 repeat protein